MSKPKKLELIALAKRDCKVGNNIQFRTQGKGTEDTTTAGDIGLMDIMLSADELGELLEEVHAHRGLFVSRKGKPDRPLLWPHVTMLPFKGKIESATVVLFTGVDGKGEIKLGVCRLKNIKLEPKEGGLTAMRCLVQSVPTLDKRITSLLEHLSGGIQVSIEYEHNPEQEELVDEKGEAKDASEDDQNEEAARAQADAFNRGGPAEFPPGAH